MKQRRKKPYQEGVAIHFGPEFCAGHREVHGEAANSIRPRPGAVTGDRNLAGGGGFESLLLDEVRQAKADSPLVLSAR